MRRIVLALVICLAGTGIAAQAPVTSTLPSFEAASIRAVPTGAAGPIDFRFQPGRFVASFLTLGQLIEQAYGLEARELIGGPEWVRVERFNITATAGGDVGTAQMRLMLQSLLAQRFQLEMVRETQTSTVYTLMARNARNFKAPAKPDGRPLVSIVREDGNGFLSYHYDGHNATMADLATMLASQLRAPVTDETKLAGNFDFRIDWTYDSPFGGLQPDPNVPTIFTALEQQVGLRLVAGKGPVPVHVIKRASRPSEN